MVYQIFLQLEIETTIVIMYPSLGSLSYLSYFKCLGKSAFYCLQVENEPKTCRGDAKKNAYNQTREKTTDAWLKVLPIACSSELK